MVPAEVYYMARYKAVRSAPASNDDDDDNNDDDDDDDDTTFSYWIRNCSHIATHLVVVEVPVGETLFKKRLGLHHFKSDRDEICQDCSSNKYASSDKNGF